jgi:predicted permease
MSSVRLTLRTLSKAPIFAATAILSLALGIGANSALFSLVDQILLRLLPVQNPRELVQLRLDGGRFGSNSGDGVRTFSHPLYLALRDRNSVLSGLTGQLVASASLIAEDHNEMISVGLVAGNFFDVLGVRPQLGRLLTVDDDRARNGSPVAVLQHAFWRSRLAGRADVVGSTIRLNGSPFTVIGVADASFEGTDAGIPTNLWVPVTMKPTVTPTWDELDNERYAWFYLFGRLRPGVSREQAQASLRVLYRQRQQEELQGRYFQQFPDTRDRFLKQSLSLDPADRGQSDLRELFERPLIVLQWLVGLVLLIACANIASLMLARVAAREREFAIRMALGAGRGDVVRQMLAESLLLAAAGGAAGLLLAAWLSQLLIHLLPFDPANLSLSTRPDLRILAFTAGTTLVTVLLFGVVPALRGSRVSPGSALKQDGGAVAGAHAHVRLRKALVGFQVGLSFVLLTGAGLFVRTLHNLREVDLGFEAENVVSFGVRPATVYDEAQKRAVFQALLEGLAAVPGVKAVGANSARLLTGGRWDGDITIPGLERRGAAPSSYYNAVTPGYFDALRIPIKAGRDLTWSEWGSAQEHCLINEALASAYFPKGDTIGRSVGQGREAPANLEIVGVFGNARYDGVRGEIPRQTFMSLGGARIRSVSSITVYVRTDGDLRRVMPRLREQVRQVDANLVAFDMRPLDDQVDRRLSNERMLSFLSSGFALLATLLAGVGLYGVLAVIVTRRTREIGIRLALGAERRGVIALVMLEILPLFAAGVGAGIAAGVAGGRALESQLFGVSAADPLVFVASVMALLGAALAAGLIPAWRAARIDPVRALRHE